MTVFLLELPVLFLLTGKGKIPFIISFFVYLLLCSIFAFSRRKSGKNIPGGIQYPIPTILLCVAGAILFYLRWNTSGRIISIASLLNKSPKQTCIIAALLLAMASSFGFDYILKFFLPPNEKKPVGKSFVFSDLFIKIYIFLSAFLTITLNSRCAPIFPFNHWVDPNTMFTVGKAVLKGYVPYRDLYEQKGPLLIFLHTAGAAISFDSFTGIWILEVIFCFFTLFFGYKILALFGRRENFILIPPAAFVIYSGYAFRTGDMAEEYCLPLLLYSLYVGCKVIKTNKLPSKTEFLWVGITSSMVFWIKYSMVGFYLGWFVFFAIRSLRKGTLKELIRGTLLIAAGLLPVTILILAYFALNHSLHIFYETYFSNNLYRFSQHMPLSFYWGNMSSGFMNFLNRNPLVFAVSILGIFWIVREKKWTLLRYVLIVYLSTFICVYLNTNFPYYSFIFGVFVVFGFFWPEAIYTKLTQNKAELIPASSVISLLFSLAVLAFFSYNVSYLENKKEDLMQYKMKEVIDQSGIENPTLLYYRTLDLGINTTTGMIPNVRYFCLFNVNNQSEMNEEQSRCLHEGCVDFVTAFSIDPDDYPEFNAYDHQGWFVGPTDNNYGYYHYYTRKETIIL